MGYISLFIDENRHKNNLAHRMKLSIIPTKSIMTKIVEI
jgi:hypothetical protein